MLKNQLKRTYKYTVFRLNIISEIPIICFEENIFFSEADILIKIDKVPTNINNIKQKGSFYQASENEFLLKIPNNANYYICNGDTVIIEPFENIKIEDLSAFLSGRILGIILHQRKLNPFHGGAIKYKDKVIAFLGNSGSGKSTIIAAFEKKGGEIISDDILLFQFNNIIQSVPSYPCIKLWQDSINNLKISPNKLTKIRSEMGKFYYKSEHFANSPLKVDFIIYLTFHNKELFDIAELHGKEKFTILKEMTYIFYNIKNTGILTKNFEICTKIAKHIPVYKLIRPSEIFDINKIIQLIEKTLNL